MALKFKKKALSPFAASHGGKEEEQKRTLSRAQMVEDLAKLQGMVDKAKQTTGMQTLASLWTDMLRGKIAGMILRWNQEACGPRDLEMPALPEEDEEVEDGYTADVLIAPPPLRSMNRVQVEVEEPLKEIGEVVSPMDQPRRASLAPIESPPRPVEEAVIPAFESQAIKASKDLLNPMMDYLDEVL